MLPYVGIFAIIEISKLVCYLYKIDEGSRIMLLSASSYIIYLFHTTFEGFAKAIFLKLPLNTDLWYVFIPEATTVIACGVIAPILLYAVFMRFRITKVLFGL